MTKTLLLPLQAEDNRPIRDALGNLVSIPEHAGAFVAAVNWHGRLLKGLNDTLEHLRANRAMRTQYSVAHANASQAVQAAEQLIAEATKAPKLPAPEEADEEELTALMVNMLDMDIGPGDFAKAIVKKYRVFLK